MRFAALYFAVLALVCGSVAGCGDPYAGMSPSDAYNAKQQDQQDENTENACEAANALGADPSSC
jgi:hypothetical protein